MVQFCRQTHFSSLVDCLLTSLIDFRLVLAESWCHDLSQANMSFARPIVEYVLMKLAPGGC